MNLFKGGFCLLAGTLMLAVSCGCRSDIYYQNRAVERARKFLLKEAADLDWKQREFVRYTDPVILHSHAVGTQGIGRVNQLKSEQRQICVTWQIPGKKGVYMVFGVSGSRMAFWYPERLIRKDYDTLPDVLAGVSQQARSYARDNLFGQISVGCVVTAFFVRDKLSCPTDPSVGTHKNTIKNGGIIETVNA